MFIRTMTLSALFLLPLLSLSGCDKKEDAGGGEEAAPKEGAEGTNLEKMVDAEVQKETGRRNFTKGMAKKSCELLPPSMVASTFDVPEGELKQMKVMGCIYTWSSDDEELKANIMMAKAHDSVDDAKRWFKNSTKSKSEEEIKAEMEQVKEKVKERKEVQGKVKQKAADSIMGAAMEMAGSIQYEDVEGVGDEARVNGRDGAMWVRVGNLTFSISAYKGPSAPKPEFKSMNTKDIIAASKKANEEWMAKTLEQRQAQVTKLAKAVVAEL